MTQIYYCDFCGHEEQGIPTKRLIEDEKVYLCNSCNEEWIRSMTKTSHQNLCAGCGKTSHVWNWAKLPTMDHDDFICPSCYNSIPKTATTSIIPVNQTTATTVKQFYCKGCYAKVTEGIDYCDKCLAWHKRWAEMGDGSGVVVDTIELDVLRQYCSAPEEWYWELPNAQHIRGVTEQNYTFIDHQARVLAVAHLDKSNGSLDRKIFKYDQTFDGDGNPSDFVYNGNLDDRLGAFIIHYLLPMKYGIQMDILFTTNEETGGSTAEFFQDDFLKLPEAERKQYNWIVSFDRKKLDVVLYQYHDDEWERVLTPYVTVGQGTFSDISELSKLGCKAANWGTGYDREHTPSHYAHLQSTLHMVEAFVNFYRDHKDTHFPHTYKEVTQNRFLGSWSWDQDDGYNAYVSHYGTCQNCASANEKLWSYYDKDEKRTIKICGACWKIFNNQSSPVTVHSHSLLPCDICKKSHIFVTVVGKKDMCYDCFVRMFSPRRDQLPENCSFCGAESEGFTKIHGSYLCNECFEHYTKGLKNNGNSESGSAQS